MIVIPPPYAAGKRCYLRSPVVWSRVLGSGDKCSVAGLLEEERIVFSSRESDTPSPSLGKYSTMSQQYEDANSANDDSHEKLQDEHPVELACTPD